MENEFDAQVIEMTINDVAGEQRIFSSVKSFLSFINEEQKFWNEAINRLQGIHTLRRIIDPINQVRNELDNFKNHFPSQNDSQRHQQLNNFKNRLPQIFSKTIFADTPLALAFMEVCQKGNTQAQNFLNYITNYPNGWFENNQFAAVEGVLLAYEFKNQDESCITKRREAEEKANASLRRILSNKTDELVTQVSSFQKDVEDWKVSFQKELQERSNTDRANREQFFAEADKRQKELEMLYREKLKLEGPANYWKTRAHNFKIAGWWWGGALVVTTVAIGAIFTWLFFAWLNSEKIVERLSAQHWQGVVLLAAVLSMFIFLIRTFGKMTFSSFHLQRDAEEREQLVYLYLALSKDTDCGEESRKIVFQSLFSRSETGLLSGDHGPTMPMSEMAKQVNPVGKR